MIVIEVQSLFPLLSLYILHSIGEKIKPANIYLSLFEILQGVGLQGRFMGSIYCMGIEGEVVEIERNFVFLLSTAGVCTNFSYESMYVYE